MEAIHVELQRRVEGELGYHQVSMRSPHLAHKRLKVVVLEEHGQDRLGELGGVEDGEGEAVVGPRD